MVFGIGFSIAGAVYFTKLINWLAGPGELELVDMAMQAVGSTKILGIASKDRTDHAAGSQRLLDRNEAAIAGLEAQNEGGFGLTNPASPP